MDNNNSNTHIDLTFNVAQLLKERVGSTRRLDFGTPVLNLFDEDGNTVEAHNLEGQAKVTRLTEGVLVQGDVKADVQTQCSRCLTDISIPVDASLEEQYQPTIDVETGHAIQRAEFEEDDGIFEIDANHLMDLTEPVRQALLVALPMRPLCREDCKGLCPECGANLNEVDCGHRPEQGDSRWASLRQLDLADFPVDKNPN
jgi:uncharacterized protein